jgi:hypothetical protein
VEHAGPRRAVSDLTLDKLILTARLAQRDASLTHSSTMGGVNDMKASPPNAALARRASMQMIGKPPSPSATRTGLGPRTAFTAVPKEPFRPPKRMAPNSTLDHKSYQQICRARRIAFRPHKVLFFTCVTSWHTHLRLYPR